MVPVARAGPGVARNDLLVSRALGRADPKAVVHGVARRMLGAVAHVHVRLTVGPVVHVTVELT